MVLLNYSVKRSLKKGEPSLTIGSLKYAADLLSITSPNPFTLENIELSVIVVPLQNVGWETILEQQKVTKKDIKLTIDDLFN
jgi:hypothetical protein